MRRQRTGGTDISFNEMAAILNMTDEELMVLVGNGLSHRWKYADDKVTKIYRFTKEEVLGLVSPLPKRPAPVVQTQAIEDEEDEPIETVRPDPRMESTAPPTKSVEKTAAKKPAVKKSVAKTKTTK